MGPLAVVGAVLGTVASAAGTLISAESAAQSASYQAQVAQNNQIVAEQNARYALASAEQKTQTVGEQGMEKLGAIRAAIAANNIDPNTGSAERAQESVRRANVLNTNTELNKGQNIEYGYLAQASNFGAQAGLDKLEASNDITGGVFGSAAKLLGGLGSGQLGGGGSGGNFNISNGSLWSGGGNIPIGTDGEPFGIGT